MSDTAMSNTFTPDPPQPRAVNFAEKAAAEAKARLAEIDAGLAEARMSKARASKTIASLMDERAGVEKFVRAGMTKDERDAAKAAKAANALKP
jgi:hypothetical protein